MSINPEGVPFGKKGLGGELDPSRMSQEEAQNEANILRSKMGVIGREGTMYEGNGKERMPTKEDYDQAEKELEEIKRLAANEPGYAKFLSRLGEVATDTGAEVSFLVYLALGQKPGFLAEANAKLLEWNRKLEEASEYLKLKKLEKAGEGFAVSRSIEHKVDQDMAAAEEKRNAA